jgi:hopanoid biosynthesis associated RND transporter like protein HpnN
MSLTLLALLAASQLEIDTDSSRMLSPDLPFQQRAQALKDAFPDLKNTIVVAVRADSSDAADTATLALSSALQGRSDVLHSVFAPSADPYLVSHGLLYLDRDALDDRLSRLAKSANLLAALRADQSLPGFLDAVDSATELAKRSGGGVAELEPLYAEAAEVLAAHRQGRKHAFGWTSALAGEPPGQVIRLITISPKLDFTLLNPAKPALAAVRDAIAELDPELLRNVKLGITGDPALRAEELQSVVSRIGLSLALSLMFVAILLRLALGSVSRAGLALGALLITLSLTAGFASAAIGALNLISIAFVVLMVGLGIDFAIHFIAHFDEQSRETPDRHSGLIRCAEAIGAALVLSAVTTSVAFFAFATTDFIGMAQLGLIGGTGVLIALAVSLTVIPAAISLWPALVAGPRPRSIWLPWGPVRRAMIWVALAAGLAGVVLSPQARFDADPMNLRNPAAESVRVYDWLASDPALAPLRLSLLVQDEDAARAAVADLADLAQVKGAHWLADLVPDDQFAKLDLIDLAYPSLLHAVEGPPVELGVAGAPVTADALARRLESLQLPSANRLAAELDSLASNGSPDTETALGAQLFRHFPLLIDRLRQQLEVAEVTVETLPEPLRARYLSQDARYRVEISPRADLRDPGEMRAFVDAVAQAVPDAAGPPDQITGAAGSVAGAILQAAALALLGCILLAWLMLRDLTRVVAILLPLLVAGATTVGASVVLDMPFNYANIIVLPLLIGVGIDSGVHFALRASDGRKSVFDTTTPRAVLYSALTTVAAFGTLGLSEHRGTASMGILLAISLVAAVAMIFALTPSIIRLMQRRGEK